MIISDFSHFLNDQGLIPNDIPKQAGNLANFLALIIDFTTETNPNTLTNTKIRCCNTGCIGEISSKLKKREGEIHWYCPKCESEGIINNWQQSKWDNS